MSYTNCEVNTIFRDFAFLALVEIRLFKIARYQYYTRKSK